MLGATLSVRWLTRHSHIVSTLIGLSNDRRGRQSNKGLIQIHARTMPREVLILPHRDCDLNSASVHTPAKSKNGNSEDFYVRISQFRPPLPVPHLSSNSTSMRLSSGVSENHKAEAAIQGLVML